MSSKTQSVVESNIVRPETPPGCTGCTNDKYTESNYKDIFGEE